MRRRPLVIAIAAVGIAIAIGAGVIGARSYLDAVRSATPGGPDSAVVTAATRAAYHETISSWPFALPPGEAFPKTPPGHIVAEQDSVRPFVSFFFQCAWEHRYLNGTPQQKGIALTNLMEWERLPPSISSADNSDGGWRQGVLFPAVRGQDAAMKRVYAASCHGDAYEDAVTKPATGLTIDRQQLTAVSAESILDPCANYRTTVPCDPAFGPNRTVDLGPREGARGAVTLDAMGVPRSYLVASGDTLAAVTDRFGGANILGLNCYRRTDTNLYAGDVLNLDQYTVTTVGSENGSTVSKNAQMSATCLTQSAIPPDQVTP